MYIFYVGYKLLKASSWGNRVSGSMICVQGYYGECSWEEQLRGGNEVDTVAQRDLLAAAAQR